MGVLETSLSNLGIAARLFYNGRQMFSPGGLMGHIVSHMVRVGEWYDPKFPLHHCARILVNKRSLTRRQAFAPDILDSELNSHLQIKLQYSFELLRKPPKYPPRTEMKPMKFLLSLLTLAGCGLAGSEKCGFFEQGFSSTGVDPTEFLAVLAKMTLMSRHMWVETLRADERTASYTLDVGPFPPSLPTPRSHF